MTQQFAIRCAASTLDAIRRHVLADLSVEHGGILVGDFDDATIDVMHAIPAHAATSDATSLTFTSAAWAEMEAERVAKHPALRVVGWYHSHPRFGIFLSRHDLYIHENFFSEPFHVAYVVDPVNDCDGFFAWAGGEITRSSEWQKLGSGGNGQLVTAPPVPVGQPVHHGGQGAPLLIAQSGQGQSRSTPPRVSTPSWLFQAGLATVALVVGILVGWFAFGGSGGEEVDPPGLAREAATIADATARTLLDLAADPSPEARAALPEALRAAEAARVFALDAAQADPSAADAAEAANAAAELETVIGVVSGNKEAGT